MPSKKNTDIKIQDPGNSLHEIKWDFLKLNIRKSCGAFCKSLKKEKNPEIQRLENKIKVLEMKLYNDGNTEMYNRFK